MSYYKKKTKKLGKFTQELGGAAMGLGVTNVVLGEMGQSTLPSSAGNMLGVVATAGMGSMAMNMAMNMGKPTKKRKYKK